ncbi:MAG TPA: hypothetical protein VGF56_08480 [Rhizomicrobium sp.]
MRPVAALFIVLAGLLTAGCSSHAPPPGRWEGTTDQGDVIIAARMEITGKGDVYVSAPDAENIQGDEAARAAIRKNLAAGLASGWGDVQPRKFEFDGKTFRKPGGVAPQVEWDSSSNTMTMLVYLGMRDAIPVKLHAVKDFSDDPFPG